MKTKRKNSQLVIAPATRPTRPPLGTQGPFDTKTQAREVAQLIVDLALALEEFRIANREKQLSVIECLHSYVEVWPYVQYMIGKMEGKLNGHFRDYSQRPVIPEPRPEDGEEPAAQANKVGNLVRELALKLELFLERDPSDWTILIQELLPCGATFAYCSQIIGIFQEAARNQYAAEQFLSVTGPPLLPRRTIRKVRAPNS